MTRLRHDQQHRISRRTETDLEKQVVAELAIPRTPHPSIFKEEIWHGRAPHRSGKPMEW